MVYYGPASFVKVQIKNELNEEAGRWVEPDTPPPSASDLIKKECRVISEMLVEKNTAYGNSIFDPVKIFSKSDTMEQINTRIDDKLSRIMRGHEFGTEDTELDLVGYLILKRVWRKMTEGNDHEIS